MHTYTHTYVVVILHVFVWGDVCVYVYIILHRYMGIYMCACVYTHMYVVCHLIKT